MKVDGNELRPGNVIEHQNSLWRVVRTQHVKPGKGGAFMQCELRDVRNGSKLNERFRADQTVERVRLEQRPYQYLFHDEDMYTFMDTGTFDQVNIPVHLIGEDQAPFLRDGMQVEIEFHEEEALNVRLPDTVTLEIAEAEPVVKGQTASSSYKPAVLENGVKTQVPHHVDSGTRVVVNTADGSYVERAKG